jgi:hypothetical protein
MWKVVVRPAERAMSNDEIFIGFMLHLLAIYK